jgi:hypothetical protein
MLGRMTRHFKVGVLVALVVASIATATALMHMNEQPGIFGLILIAPALPVLFCLVRLFPPPMGDSGISPWDYLMLLVAVLVSAVVWGLIAGLLSKYVFSRRKSAA